MTDAPYVPLDRRFVDVTEEPFSAWSRRMMGVARGETWEAIVPGASSPPEKRSAVVVVAPSGVGKTAEFLARAAHLQREGVSAFFMRAVDVAASGVAGALGDASSFRAWQASSARGVFFIDAVDEARIEGNDLEHVLLRFAQEVDPATKQVQLVLSSRNDIWSSGDARHVVRVLALPTENSPVRVVRLEPLSQDDVVLYAKANGVRDPDAFRAAFDEEELDLLFELRPPDARILVDYWKQQGAFGSWTEMLEASIEGSVRNENRRHALNQQFTLEDARKGLARLGAATVLGKRPLISLPGSAHPDEVNSEHLFPDQRPAATSQLLAMGLFAQKGLHSVQLPQGAHSHYLAASWLGERARRGWDLRALEDELFVTPFGGGRTLTPPSRSPVVGWVAGSVPALRKRLLRDLPHVLLFEGDPSKLARGECIEALRCVLANIESGLEDPSPTRGTLRQVARHDIGDAVVRLLGRFRGTSRAERLLLRLAEVGRYQMVVPHALALALSPGVDEVIGPVAIRVVASAGTEEERRRLLSLAAHSSDWIRLAVVQALAPAILNGATLVQMVLATKNRDVASLLGPALIGVALVDIDTILSTVQPFLASSQVDDATEARLEVAWRLAITRLSRGGGNMPSWMAALLLAIESHLARPVFASREASDSLDALFSSNSDMRRTLWAARVAAGTSGDGFDRVLNPRFGAARVEDLEWLWSLREAANEEVRTFLRWPLTDALHRASPAERDQLVMSSRVSPDLKTFIELTAAQDAQAEAARHDQEVKEKVEKASQREKNIADLEPLRAEIEGGQHGEALVWAWQHLTGTDGHRSRLETGRLVELVGPELADGFIIGFQRWWRQHEPSLPQPGNNTVLLVDLAGLTGLSLEIERGLALAALSDPEVERAVRYALCELNGFPVWFDALRAAHPVLVRAVLSQVVRAEWMATVEHHGVISRAPYEPGGTAELLRELVISELQESAPRHARTIHYVVAALLLSTKAGREIGITLHRHTSEAAGGDIQVLGEWLRGWSHFAPEGAAAWLRGIAAADQSRFLQVVAQVAALLEDDFKERGRSVATTAWAPTALEAWVRMLHVAVRPEDDINRSGRGVFSPGQRDRAQEFRIRCVSRLARDPSREAFEALQRIRASSEMKPYRDTVDRCIFAQLTTAAENLATPWTVEDILTVERGDERPPRSNADLCALVQRHLARVAGLLENDDFSYAMLFDEKTDEGDVQCWVASSLMLVSRGLYTVEREPEVQDYKVMDISITVPAVGRVPVEIKPLYASRYSYRQLKAFVSEQLVGRYMRPASVDRGIFLLVPLKLRTWRVDGRVLSFNQVRTALAAHAKKVGDNAYKEALVMSIDVAAARSSKKSTKAASRSTPVLRKALARKGIRTPPPKKGRSKRRRAR